MLYLARQVILPFMQTFTEENLWLKTQISSSREQKHISSLRS
jgi:hypothetical protein